MPKEITDGTERQGYFCLVLAAPAASSLSAGGAEKESQNSPRACQTASDGCKKKHKRESRGRLAG